MAGYQYLPTVIRDNTPDTIMLAAFVAAVVALWKYHRLAFAPIRWFWRKAWRDQTGAHFGPSARASALVRIAVTPLIDDVKIAARAQHDSQNKVLTQIADTLNDHGARIEAIEEVVTNPPKRPPDTKERSTDT
jgi:hypothetical protein